MVLKSLQGVNARIYEYGKGWLLAWQAGNLKSTVGLQ